MKNLSQKEPYLAIPLAIVRLTVLILCIVLAFSVMASTPAYAQSTTCHTVRSGETLTTIAVRYGTTVSVIMRTSGVTNANSIRVGQQICFTTNSAPIEVVATVTPTSSAPRANVTSMPNTPESERPSPMVTAVPRVVPTHPATVYTVRRGDSLLRISSLYGVSMSQLMAYNGLNSTTIYVGQTIRIPPR